MLKEFKEFAMRGNVLDLAVGVIIGAAFGKIISLNNPCVLTVFWRPRGGVGCSWRFKAAVAQALRT